MALVRVNINFHQQQGVGLIEVMVALLLLAVAALGYTALQTRSLGTTDEAIVRTQAQTLLREFAERIRTLGTSDTVLNEYQSQFDANTVPTTACTSTSTEAECLEHQVASDISDLKEQAVEAGVTLNMVTCPGTTDTAQTKCLIAAWNATSASIGTSDTDCIKSTGDYIFNADCVYMEAY